VKFDIHTADVLDALATMPDNHYHGVLTDPPYGLGFMGKRWDHEVPSALVWAEVLRVCKPGAYALVFGGTRTWHRLAVALEDAGWELRDTLMWLYGSGFPRGFEGGAVTVPALRGGRDGGSLGGCLRGALGRQGTSDATNVGSGLYQATRANAPGRRMPPSRPPRNAGTVTAPPSNPRGNPSSSSANRWTGRLQATRWSMGAAG